MITGVKAERTAGTLVCALFACMLANAPARTALADASPEVPLQELMGELSRVHTAGGNFTERKYLSILSEPLVLKGSVQYRSPDYVKKQYDDPNSESYEVRGDILTIEFPDGRRRELGIDEHPVLRAFVESYRGTLAGDLETLQMYFDLQLDGDLQDWALRLTPRNDELARYLSAVVMFGRGATIYSVETLEASGDRTVMVLDNPGD